MNKQITVQAETLEQARRDAALQLGVEEQEILFEILQMPQKKKLGLFGGSPAIVRATAQQAAGVAAEKAQQYLQTVLEQMGAQGVTVKMQETEGGCTLKLDGENVSMIIGRRGETLDALQYMAGLVANRYAEGGYYRVNIEAGDYREKRAAVLVNLAQKTARQVLKNGRKTSLEPMNPYERRIIHTAIQEMEGVTSWSVGSDDRRHVVIGLEGAATENGAEQPTREHKPRRSGRGKNRNADKGERAERGNRGERRPDVAPERPARQVREFVPRSNPMRTAEDAAPVSRTESETERKATLYGRIDL